MRAPSGEVDLGAGVDAGAGVESGAGVDLGEGVDAGAANGSSYSGAGPVTFVGFAPPQCRAATERAQNAASLRKLRVMVLRWPKPLREIRLRRRTGR